MKPKRLRTLAALRRETARWRAQGLSYAVVPTMGLRQFQLGPHPIGARDQQRPLEPLRQTTQATEATQTAHHLRPARGLHAGSDALHKGPPGHDVHPSCAVVHDFYRLIQLQ